MLIRRCALCAALLAAGLFAFGDALAEDDDKLERASVDISDLTQLTHETQAPLLQVWPSNFTPMDRDRRRDRRVNAFLTEDQIMEVIRLSVEPRSWEEVEGADLQFRAGRLRVSNRPDVLRKVRAYVAALRAQAAQRIHVNLGVRIGDPAAYPSVADGARAGDSASLTLRSNIGRMVEVVERQMYVQDYEVEIAQGSVIGNPVTMDVLSGLVAEMIATPTTQGDQIVLSGIVQHAELIGMRSVDTGADEEYLARPPRSNERKQNGIVELPTYRTTAVVVNTMVAPGTEVNVPVVYDGVQRNLWMRARVQGGARAPGIHPLGALTLNPFDAQLRWYHNQRGWESGHKGLPSLAVLKRDSSSSPEQAEEVLEDLSATLRFTHESAGANANVLRPDLLFIGADAELGKRIGAKLRREEQPWLRGATVDVRVLSVPPGAVATGVGAQVGLDEARLLAAGRIPTLHGRRGALLAGTLHAYMEDYDVEVAQEARIADPIVNVCFDGLVFNVRPSYPEGAATAELAIEVVYSTQRPTTKPYDSGTRYLGPIDRVEGAVRAFETSVQMPVGGTYVFDAGVDPNAKNEGRRLVVELRLSAR